MRATVYAVRIDGRGHDSIVLAATQPAAVAALLAEGGRVHFAEVGYVPEQLAKRTAEELAEDPNIDVRARLAIDRLTGLGVRARLDELPVTL